MFDIWASVAELAQPCLYRPLSDRMIGSDGLVRKEILTSLDRLFVEHLARGRASFQAPPVPQPMAPEHRFVATSALQKCIRRGDAEGAMRYAQQGCSVDAKHTFRRFATCAVEDVGLGNLVVVGMTLAALGHRSMWQNGGAEELAAYLAYLLAISPKSRLACDLLSIVDYDRSLGRLKAELAKAPVGHLRSLAEDRTMRLSHRMPAAWLLAGTARFRGTSMPRVGRQRTEFMQLIARRRMPLVLYYIADRTAGRLSDAMFVACLLMSEMIAADPNILVVENALPDAAMIAGFPAAAYDLHTQQGRIALSRFGRECRPIAELLRVASPTLRETAIRHGVFIAEGGLLREQLRFEYADVVERDAHYAELAFGGIDDPQHQAGLLSAIRERLPDLNNLRYELAAHKPG